jgi:hypothetical protein
MTAFRTSSEASDTVIQTVFNLLSLSNLCEPLNPSPICEISVPICEICGKLNHPQRKVTLVQIF